MPFKKGVSGNPGGKPKGSKDKLPARKHRLDLSYNFIRDFNNDWKEHGAQAIRDMREKDVVAYVKTAATIIPKGIDVSGSVNVDVKSVGLSILADLIEEAERRAAGGVIKDVTPERPVLSSDVRSESD